MSRPVQKLYPLEVRNKKEKEGESNVSEESAVVESGGSGNSSASRQPRVRRAAALDAQWRTRAILEP